MVIALSVPRGRPRNKAMNAGVRGAYTADPELPPHATGLQREPPSTKRPGKEEELNVR
jgi:hypothetical protein